MPTTPANPDERELIDRITALENLKNSIAAQQADAILAFAQAHVASQIAGGAIEPDKLERSIAAQIGLACRVSPTEGRRRMRTARDLHAGHTHVRTLFAAGQLSEYRTQVVVAATTHLDPTERAAVDTRLAEHRIETLGVRRLHDLARTIAAEIAPDKFLTRAREARTGRRVSVRPAADGMADLIAHLPVEQAVSCYAALAKAVNDVAVSPEPLTRGRGQIMADTLVERLTGQTTAENINVDVQILIPVEALLDPDRPAPAQVPGHGPIPADVLARAGHATWRRLLTRNGIIIGGDTRTRTFTGRLADLIRARDGGRCREPYCDAPIRHLDHIQRWADGGTTSYDNGRGLCEFHNHVRETPGWKAETTDNTIITTTPTGHTYTSEIGTIHLRTASENGRPQRDPRNQDARLQQQSRGQDVRSQQESHDVRAQQHSPTDDVRLGDPTDLRQRPRRRHRASRHRDLARTAAADSRPPSGSAVGPPTRAGRD